MRRALALLVACLVATAAAGTQNPTKIAITPGSPDAAILMLVPILAAPYSIGFAPYDPVTRALGASKVGGRYDVETPARPKSASPAEAPEVYYAMVSVLPGTYVVRDLSQQQRWSACYGRGTVSFSVAPGQIVYLGLIDTGRMIAQLQAVVLARPGDERLIGYEQRTYFEGFGPPAFRDTGDGAALAASAAWVKTRSPGTNVMPVAASFSPVKFGTGTDLFGIEKVCTGGHRRDPRDAN